MAKINSFKTYLLSGVVTTSLLLWSESGNAQVMSMVGSGLAGAGVSMAASAISPWAGIGLSAAGGIITYLTMGVVAWQEGINVDALQVAAEAWVYSNMLDVTYEWEPEPEESYKKATEYVKGTSGCSTTDTAANSQGAYDFEIESITATGIEAVGLEATPKAMISGRPTAMEGMTFLTSDEGGTTFKEDLPTDEILKISGTEESSGTQTANEQFLGTAGVARAELALMTAKQAAVDGSAASEASSSNTEYQSGDLTETESHGNAHTLNGLVGSADSAVAAMRIQTLMNLELAQRINLTDTLQGSSLSLQAARLLRESNPLQ